MPPRAMTGAVNALIEKAGLRIVAQKRVRWSKAQAEKFYEVHKARPFYGDLVAFMTSGPSWCRCSRARTRSRPTAT